MTSMKGLVWMLDGVLCQSLWILVVMVGDDD